MRLKIDDYEFNVEVRETEEYVSKHTEKMLQRVLVDFSARGIKSDEKVKGLLEKAIDNGLESIEAEGSPNRKWAVQQKSYSFASPEDEDTVYHYTWELEDQENLKAERLLFDEFDLKPYAYEERIDDDALIIVAKVQLNGADAEHLRELNSKGTDYFPVIRKGVSDTSVEMRFGRLIWSKHDDIIKQEIVLVEKAYDEGDQSKHGFLEPEFSNIERYAMGDRIMLRALLELLVDKGHISNEEKVALMDISAERFILEKFNLWQVKDLDEWD